MSGPFYWIPELCAVLLDLFGCGSGLLLKDILQKGTLVFLGVFIVAMMGIQFASFIFMRFQLKFSVNIANTAHISGALSACF